MRQNLYYSLTTRPLMIVAILVGSIWGMNGVAIAYSASIAVMWPLSLCGSAGSRTRPSARCSSTVRGPSSSSAPAASSRRSRRSAIPTELPFIRVIVGAVALLAWMALIALVWPPLPPRHARPALRPPYFGRGRKGGGKPQARRARGRRPTRRRTARAMEQDLADRSCAGPQLGSASHAGIRRGHHPLDGWTTKGTTDHERHQTTPDDLSAESSPHDVALDQCSSCRRCTAAGPSSSPAPGWVARRSGATRQRRHDLRQGAGRTTCRRASRLHRRGRPRATWRRPARSATSSCDRGGHRGEPAGPRQPRPAHRRRCWPGPGPSRHHQRAQPRARSAWPGRDVRTASRSGSRQRIYPRADHVIAISHPVGGELVAGFGVRGERMTVVPNPATAKVAGRDRVVRTPGHRGGHADRAALPPGHPEAADARDRHRRRARSAAASRPRSSRSAADRCSVR